MRVYSLSKRLTIGLFFTSFSCFSQTGGPPMLTDDPGTVPVRHFEINTSIVSEIGEGKEFQIPLVDINYGYGIRTQFKIEMPFIVNENENNFGNPAIGVKYRFFESDSQRVLISTYPQVLLSIHNDQSVEYKIPVQFEFHMKKFILGEEIGFITAEARNYFFFGTLGGVNLTNKFEVMGELYFVWKTMETKIVDTKFNVGLRYMISEKIALLASAGAGRTIDEGKRLDYFISYTGVRLML
jgi:hypothetical protein